PKITLQVVGLLPFPARLLRSPATGHSRNNGKIFQKNKTERFMFHASDVNTLHNNLVKQCEDMLRQDQLIHVDSEYRIRLGYSLALSEALLNEGLSSRDSDES
ncbi:hypothetical protein M8C21_008858, partial [Ambrosia artemisiifolia]